VQVSEVKGHSEVYFGLKVFCLQRLEGVHCSELPGYKVLVSTFNLIHNNSLLESGFL
jgi:hypothetical protein